MSKRYPGNFITGNPVALSQSSNAGVWDLKDQYQAQNTDTWQEASGIYAIPRSLRFRRSVTAYLSRTMGTPSNNKIFTYSAWVKLGAIVSGTSYSFFSGHNTDENNELWFCWTSNKFVLQQTVNGSGQAYADTDAIFRDPSAWYHVVVGIDSTQAASRNRVKLYVNGVQQTFSSYSGLFLNQNFTPWMNYGGAPHRIGQLAPPNNGAMDGYMAELNFVDGQQLDPSYFGYTDSITGIWYPKRYTGGYGNNGFYLPFNENQSLAQLGKNFGNASNYLTYSEQFNNAAWLKPAAPVAPTTSTDAIAAPNGAITADAVVFSGSTTHPAYQEYTVATSAGQSWTASMYVKQATGTDFALQCTLFNGSGVLQDGYNNFTFDSATKITSSATNSFMSVGSQYIGDGWHRIWATNTNQSGSAGTYVRVSIGQRSAPTTWSIYCWGAQLTLGTTLLPYTQTVASIINNDWTTNFISLTAGATYDSMVDSPTNVFTSATDTGGVVPGNYCTLNPLPTANWTFTNGNLRGESRASGDAMTIGTIGVTKGKWYFEGTVATNTNKGNIGIIGTTTGSFSGAAYDTAGGNNALGYVLNGYDGQRRNNSTSSAYYGSVIPDNSNVGVAFDLDNNKIFVRVNGTWLASSDPVTGANPMFNLTAGATYFPSISDDWGSASVTWDINFGQSPFAYAPPAGFKTLNTTNVQALGTTEISKTAIQSTKWMDVNLYGGTGIDQNIVNSGFQPDLVWIKSRDQAGSHHVYDSLRSTSLALFTDATSADNSRPNCLLSFNNTGFTVGTSSDGNTNISGYSYVGWQWKQSPASGFNIVPYTGTGVGRSISHNLGVTPKFIIVKGRSNAYDWVVWHTDAFAGANTSRLFLNTSDAVQTGQGSGPWNSTSPTSSNFSVGTHLNVNETGVPFIAYLWAEVPGFSKFGSYVGNGSTNGPFVYTGFRPAFILTKNITTGGYWWEMVDNKRSLLNPRNRTLYANVSDSQYTASSYNKDLLSNGFKMRGDSAGHNSSGDTFIYAAFAESPFGLNNRAL